MKSSLFRFLAVLASLVLAAALFAASPFYRSALTATAVLASPGITNLTGYNIANPNGATVFVQLFDAASAAAVTLGTTAPTLVLSIPASGVLDGTQASPVTFANGLVVAATTTATGSSAPGTALSAAFFVR